MRWLLSGLLSLMACTHRVAGAGEEVDLLVIAPHPDDEVLLAAGAMQRAVKAGKHVAVIIVTNGDFTCERDGYLREAESIAALKSLGVVEADVHFLGYPDGALAKLGQVPLDPMEHRDATGQCVARTGTYADRGAGRLDEHTRRTGAPAEWTSSALTGDLAALLQRLKPHEVYVVHGIDDHPDHAMTYVYFRRALDQVDVAPAVVHRGVVHAGRCWPSDCATWFTPDARMPPLPPPLEAYTPDERRVIDAQKKLAAIGFYTSQAGTQPKLDWLASFARREEVFFTERYVRAGQRWVQAGSIAKSDNERSLQRDGFEELNVWGPDGFARDEVRASAPPASSR